MIGRAVCWMVLVVTACSPSSRPDEVDGGADAGGDAPSVEHDADLGDGGDASGDGLDPLAILGSEYCAPLVEGVCQANEACGCGTARADCESTMTANCIAGGAEYAAAVRRGELAIDRVALARRVRHSRALLGSCEVPDFAPDFLVSTIPIGADCVGGAACASGAGVCSAGQCVAAPDVGMPCTEHCAHGHTCVAGTCREGRAAGDACTVTRDCAPLLRCASGTCLVRGASDAPCLDDMACSVGLRCVGGACQEVTGDCVMDGCGVGSLCEPGGSNVCQAPQPAGGPCFSTLDCGDGLHCVGGRCEVPPGPFEGCAGACADGLYCSDEARCLPLLELGAPCTTTRTGIDPCSDGLLCDGIACVALADVGEACDDLPCAAPARCDRSVAPSRCVLSDVGGPCEGRTGCGEGARCDASAGTCVRLRATGEACGTDYDCAAGLACVGERGASFCATPPVLGEACGAAGITPFTCGPSLRCSDRAMCRPALCSGMPL